MNNRYKLKVQTLVSANIDILLKVPETSAIGNQMLSEIQHWGDKEYEMLIKVYTKAKPTSKQVPKNSLVLIDKSIKSKFDTLIILPTKGVFPKFISNLQQSIKIIPQNICLCIVLDGVIDPILINKVNKILKSSNISYALFNTNKNVGYVHAVKYGYEFMVNPDVIYTGFLDDDAFITRDNHYDFLTNELKTNRNLYAISGLAVDKNNGNLIHDFFNLSNDYDYYQSLISLQVLIDKPHIHGGGGAMLMRQPDFLDSVNESLRLGTLIGPTISSLARSKGRMVKASVDSLVLHPTSGTLFAWLIQTKKYFNTWSELNQQHESKNIKKWIKYRNSDLKITKKYRSQEEYIMRIMLSVFRSQFDNFYLS